MAGRYKNVGARIPRRGKPTVERDEVFEPTPSELLQFRYKLKPVDPVPSPPSAPRVNKWWGNEWPLAMDPALYLRLHPEGEMAELAKQTVGDREPPR